MVDKGGVIAVNGVGCVEKYRFQILLDVADFRGVLFHAVKDKFNVAAVELHKLCFDKLCRIIVPGDTDCLSFGADSFKDKGHNLVQAFPVNVGMLDKMLILDIVLDDFLIHTVCVCRFRSFPFRLCRFFPQRRGVRGKDRNGMVI